MAIEWRRNGRKVSSSEMFDGLMDDILKDAFASQARRNPQFGFKHS